MAYKEVIPIDDLSKYIQCFWSMENIPKDETITILPDGCFDIVIYIYKNENDIKLTGIWNKPIKVKKYKGIDVVGVRFYPSALDLFFNIDVSDRINNTLKFNKEMLRHVKNMDLDIVLNLKSVTDIISFWNLYFIFLVNSITDKSVFKIDLVSKKSIEEIAFDIGISSRHLSRLFNEKLGLTTKSYINILRFIKAKEMLTNGESISETIYQCGYFDQSHLTKEFKKYSTFTPKQFIKQV